MTTSYLFSIDPKNYNGQVISVFDPITKVSYYSKQTTDEYLTKNPTHLIITDDEHYDNYYKPYIDKQCERVTEITEEQYHELIEQLPPLKWEDGCYWCLEATQGIYHAIWVNCHGRYFQTLGSHFDKPLTILERVNNYINIKTTSNEII